MFAITVIGTALVLSLARLLLPMAHGYREEIAAWASTALGQEVRISGLEAEWQGLWPILRLRGVSIAGGVRYGSTEIEAVDLILDLSASLHQFRLVPAELSLVHPRLMLPSGLEADPKAWAFDSPGLWQLGQSQITLHDAQVCLEDRKIQGCLTGNARLSSDGKHLQGDADLRLSALWGETVHLVLNTINDNTNSDDWVLEWYLGTKKLHLAPLVHRLRPEMVIDGMADLRLWGTLDQSGLSRLEGSIDRLLIQTGDIAQGPRDLALAIEGFSWVQKATGWQLDLAGLRRLDSPSPGATLQIRLNDPSETRDLQIRAQGLTLTELASLSSINGLLPEKITSAVTALAPRGELETLQLRLPLPSTNVPNNSQDPPKDLLESPPEIPQGDQEIVSSYSEEKSSELSDLEFWNRLEVQANFTGLVLRPWQGIPGVEGLSGEIKIAKGVGTIDFDEQHGKLYLAHLFGGPWIVNRLAGAVAFRLDTTGWRLDIPKLTFATPAIALEASGALFIPTQGIDRSPRLDLDARLLRADGSQVSAYLPRRIMPNPAVAWLDRSILGGKITRGTIQFHGNLADFPFDHGEGRFTVNCQVTGGELNYHPEWPVIHALDTHLAFHGRAMEIRARTGRILDSTLEDTTVVISDLDQEPPLLKVRGLVRGPMADIPRLIRDTPLTHRYGQYVATLEGQGTMALTIELDMHTKPAEITHVAGHLDLINGADLRWRDPEVAVNAASGTLEFSVEGIRGHGITGRILGLPVELALQSRVIKGQPTTIIEVQGKLEPNDLQTYLPPPLLKRLQGRTTWQSTVTLPEVPPGEKLAPLIHLESNLQGLALDLPSPFDKPANQTRALLIETVLAGKAQREVKIAYGTLANTVMELEADGHLIRGEVQFGKDLATLPVTPGLFHLRTDLAEMVLDDWLGLAADFTQGDGSVIASSGPTPLREEIRIGLDAQVGNLQVGKQHFHGVELFANREKKGWEARFSARETVGRWSWSEDGLNLNLDRLILSEKETASSNEEDKRESQTTIDPRHLPPLHLRCADLHLNLIPMIPVNEKRGQNNQSFPATENQKGEDLALGSLKIDTYPDPIGLTVQNLQLRTSTLQIDGKGYWHTISTAANNLQKASHTSDSFEGQFSSLDLNFKTDDLGSTLNALGYAGALEGGKLKKGLLHTEWSGPPHAFATKNLNGTLTVEVENGRLLQVSPGRTGRIFGLLSLQALPRRLALDFSDVFLKGLAFDRIQGDFEIEHGNAHSNNLGLQGPAADIKIEGRIGLSARDYDQKVTVTPSTGVTLPLAGALAAGSVGIGAALLLTQHLLQPNIDRITQAHYTLRGPWDDPKVEPSSSVNMEGKNIGIVPNEPPANTPDSIAR
ncbi:conserved hypothetical protein [Gammaproteobacteria bacterium]